MNKAKNPAALRASGLRPIEIWVPDTSSAGFVEECRRQSLVVAEAEWNNADQKAFMDEAVFDIEVWPD